MGTRSLARSSKERVFFVYDHQKHGEEADPKDAILFFYPPSVDVKEQIALVGGLIGTVDFCIEVLQHTPSLVTLTSCKFALLKSGPFILGLSSELSVPEENVRQHLHYLWDTFCLFQGSLLMLKQRIGVDGFTLELYRVWNCYFSLCQSFCDHLSQAFGVIPYTDLSLPQSGVFLQASHILQTAQQQTGVVGGLLLNKNRVVCTQLSTDITRRLLLLMPQERNFPCVELKTDFDLPTGVRLLCAFLTPEELSSLGPRKKQTTRWQQAEGSREPGHVQHPSSSLHTSALSTPPSVRKPVCGLSAVLESAELGEGEEFQDGEGSEFVLCGTDTFPPLSSRQGGDVSDVRKVESPSETNSEGTEPGSDTATTTTDRESTARQESSDSGTSSDVKTQSGGDNVIDTALPERITSIPAGDSDSPTQKSELSNNKKDEGGAIENGDDLCDDGNVHDGRSRYSADFSAAEDGGAELSGSYRSSDRNTGGRTASDSDSGSPTLSHHNTVENQDFSECPQEEGSADRLGHGESTGVSSNSRADVEQQHRTDAEEEQFSSRVTPSPTPPLVDNSVSDREVEQITEKGDQSRTDSATFVDQGDADDAGTGAEGPEAVAALSEPEGEGETPSSSSRVSQNVSGPMLHQSFTGTGDSSLSAEDDGNSHYVFPSADCRQMEIAPEPHPPSSLAVTDAASNPGTAGVSPEDSVLSSISASSQGESVFANNPTVLGTDPSSDCKGRVFPKAQEVSLTSSSQSTAETDATNPPSVPVDVELHLDWVQGGRRASSVLTVSDDMLSPNKERLCFDSTLQPCESSGSGSGSGGIGGSRPASTRPPPLRECSTEPSSSDFTHSQDTAVSSQPPSSSTPVLSSPTFSLGGHGEGVWGRDGGEEGRQRVLLYVQGHMDTLLVLVVEDPALATKRTVNTLWRSSLARLAELDFAVSDTNSLSIGEMNRGHASYLYLKYLKSSQAMQGTATAPVTSLANELVSSSVLLHDTFTSMAQANDVVCKTHTTCCYGHRSVSSETFFQITATKGGGYPDPRDIAFSLDQYADRKLYADHSSALL